MPKEWIIEAPIEVIENLAKSFQFGPILGDGSRQLNEELVTHLNGLKIQIFSKEHPPPHFRVIYNGETANYKISDCTKLNGGLNKWYRNIKKWHEINKFKLVQVWDETRPSDCTVGDYTFNSHELEQIKNIVASLENDCSDEMKFLKNKYESVTRAN